MRSNLFRHHYDGCRCRYSEQAHCTNIIRFDNYNDAVAGSIAGQHFGINLGNNDTLFFRLSQSGGPITAVVAPSWANSCFGQYSYTGLTGSTVLYQANTGTSTVLLFDSIYVKAGYKTVPAYSIIAIDGESTGIYESIDVVTAPGTNWYFWDSLKSPGTPQTVPLQTGVGTDSVSWTPNPPFNVLWHQAWLVAADNPPFVRVRLSHTSTGYEGIALGIRRSIAAPDTVICGGGSVTIVPFNAPAGTLYSWSAPVITPAGSVSGATAQTTPINAIQQTLVSNTSAPATLTYTITPSSPSCNFLDTPFTFTVTVLPSTPSFSLGNDTAYCGNFSQTLSTGYPGTLWSTGATGPQITVSAPGTYSASLNNSCGSVADAIVITQAPAPAVNLGNDTSFCPAQTFLLTASTPNATFLWQDGSTGSSYTVNTAGNYSVTATTGPGCSATDAINVSYSNTGPQFELGKDTVVCNNDGVLLTVPVTGATFLWNTNATDSFLHVTSSGTYSVTVTGACGNATDKINVEVYGDNCNLLIPTAFSPNGDGVNDIYRVHSKCPVVKFHMQIFNRWGEEVFSTSDVAEGWDGVFRSQKQGLEVFVYQLEYWNFCEQKLKHMSGNFTLVR